MTYPAVKANKMVLPEEKWPEDSRKQSKYFVTWYNFSCSIYPID